KKVYQMTRDIDWTQYQGMVLLNHGVFTFDDDARRCYENMIDLVTAAEDYINSKTALELNADNHSKTDLKTLARTRQQVAAERGTPVYALLDTGAQAVSFACLDNVDSIATRGPLTPDHIIRTKQSPLIIRADADMECNPVGAYATAYQSYFDRNTNGQHRCLDRAPRWAVWKNQGLVSFGASLQDAAIIADISRHTIKAIQLAEKLGGWCALPEKDLYEVEYWELEQAKLKSSKNTPEFQGKVALVTGAASGIGKACVEALIAKGAAVAALDMNPAIEGLYHNTQVLEIVCDVTCDTVLKQSVEQTVRRFGGLDILVSNAGAFSVSKNIEDMDEVTWHEGLAVNLTSHQRLMQYAIPYLRYGIDPAMVIIATKNVPAPGPGAAAYSAAKAGLTQLARVAALELGKDNIRVNTIHPNAVFDTGVWTDEVLQDRAQHYGMTVQAYKTNNVLHTEVSAYSVAQMVCAMAGKTFAKTTGAQVPVDGGNERVI
ncbi:MAG: SDR family oxidoreductase, partial [Gammaproteobacteria bacterium]